MQMTQNSSCPFISILLSLTNTPQQICPWMTASLLTLNLSKTEFLLISLKELSEICNSSLNTTHFSRNFGYQQTPYFLQLCLCTS